MIKLNSE